MSTSAPSRRGRSSTPPDDRPQPVRPVTALALTTVGFVALTIFALGMTSLVLDQDVIATRGVGEVPGIVGTALATATFAASVWLVIRRGRPAYPAALGVALAVYLAYLVGVGVAAAATGVDLALAASVVGELAIGWFGPLVGASALLSALVAVALVRTRAERPRWPWEPTGEG